MNPRRSAIAALLAVICVSVAPASAQIVTENAGVLSPETPTFHESFGYLRTEHGHELLAAHELIVGLDRYDELRLTVPTAWRKLSTPGGDIDFFGVGDATLRWKHALWREDDVMESGRWSLLLALTAPTGEKLSSDDGVAIPPDVRPSRGDWTLGIGTAYTYIHDRDRFATEASFRYRTSHEGVQLGESFDLNLAYWYRITPATFVDVSDTLEVRGVMELLTSYRWDGDISGVDQDDGGVLVQLAPGIQVFPTDSLLLQANIELPLVQTIDDTYGERRFAALFTLKFLF